MTMHPAEDAATSRVPSAVQDSPDMGLPVQDPEAAETLLSRTGALPERQSANIKCPTGQSYLPHCDTGIRASTGQ
eukprot:scaffold52618_cov46-Prasinocladus_malaysianus.AAC.2